MRRSFATRAFRFGRLPRNRFFPLPGSFSIFGGFAWHWLSIGTVRKDEPRFGIQPLVLLGIPLKAQMVDVIQVRTWGLKSAIGCIIGPAPQAFLPISIQQKVKGLCVVPTALRRTQVLLNRDALRVGVASPNNTQGPKKVGIDVIWRRYGTS